MILAKHDWVEAFPGTQTCLICSRRVSSLYGEWEDYYDQLYSECPGEPCEECGEVDCEYK